MKKYICIAFIASCLCSSCSWDALTGTNEELAVLHIPVNESYTEIQVEEFDGMSGGDGDDKTTYDDINNPTYYKFEGQWITANWVNTNPNILSIHIAENKTGQTRRYMLHLTKKGASRDYWDVTIIQAGE